MAAKKKIDPEDSTVNTNDAFEAFLKDNEKDHFNYIEPVNKIISTGSLNLDAYIKIRSGSVVRLAGKGAELGKTSESLVIAQNYMDTMPRSKTLYIKAEAKLGPELKARSGMKYVTKASEWEYGTVFIFSTNIFETIAKCLEDQLPKMHEAGEHLCIILDSLDGVILKSDAEKDLWGGDEQVKVAGVPLLSKILFRRLAMKINHYDALMLITCQYAAEIKLDKYSKAPVRQGDSSGGNAVNHQNDITISYALRTGGDYIYEKEKEKPDPIKNKCLGLYATVDIKKSSTDVTGSRVRIPIQKGRIGNAIWKEREVVELAVQWGLLVGKGAWFNFGETLIEQALADGVVLKEQHQGLNGVYKYIDENKDVFNWLYNRFSKTVSA